MEARTAFDRLLLGREEVESAPEPVIPRENDEAQVARQNREALASWGALGVPVNVS